MSSSESTNVLTNAVGRIDFRTKLPHFGKCVANGSTQCSFHYRVGTEARTEAAYLIGVINGERGRALASHRCGPGSTLGVDAQCGLIILSLVCPCLYLARAVRAKNKSEVYMEF